MHRTKWVRFFFLSLDSTSNANAMLSIRYSSELCKTFAESHENRFRFCDFFLSLFCALFFRIKLDCVWRGAAMLVCSIFRNGFYKIRFSSILFLNSNITNPHHEWKRRARAQSHSTCSTLTLNLNSSSPAKWFDSLGVYNFYIIFFFFFSLVSFLFYYLCHTALDYSRILSLSGSLSHSLTHARRIENPHFNRIKRINLI